MIRMGFFQNIYILYLARTCGRGMATEVHLDALPYIDHGYDEPGVREEV